MVPHSACGVNYLEPIKPVLGSAGQDRSAGTSVQGYVMQGGLGRGVGGCVKRMHPKKDVQGTKGLLHIVYARKKGP